MINRNRNALIVMPMVIAMMVIINGQVLAASMAGGSKTDSAVAIMVAGKIANDTLLGDMPIGVANYMGTITLSGAVFTPQQKAHAAELARSVDGVKKVTNLLEVVEPVVKR